MHKYTNSVYKNAAYGAAQYIVYCEKNAVRAFKSGHVPFLPVPFFTLPFLPVPFLKDILPVPFLPDRVLVPKRLIGTRLMTAWM